MQAVVDIVVHLKGTASSAIQVNTNHPESIFKGNTAGDALPAQARYIDYSTQMTELSPSSSPARPFWPTCTLATSLPSLPVAGSRAMMATLDDV